MPKKLRVWLCVFLVIPFNAWPLEPEHWVTLPGNGFLTVTGVSGRRLRRNWELESAREDAARKALWYYGLKGSIRTVSVSGPDARFTTDTSLEPLRAGELPAIRNALRFDPETDVLRTGNAVFVRFTCPAPGAESLNYESAPLADGRPGWIRRPPRIAGYTAAVGFAGKRRSISETVNKSCENAAAALLAARSIHLETLDLDYAGRAASRITGTAEGELTGFMVLELWIDPATKAVWTLAAARKIDTGK